MRVTVEVVGEGTEAVAVDDGDTYADVVRAVGYSPHEVSVIVDGTPVPEDQPVASERVRVLRLIKGGASARRAALDSGSTTPGSNRPAADSPP